MGIAERRSEHLREELDFWRRWLTEESFRAAREPRLQPERPLAHWIRDLVDAPEGAVVRILDVGSGPLTTLGQIWPGRRIDLTLTDPLAEEYNAVLAECGLGGVPRLLKATGEEIDGVFPEAHFDFVHSANALDHAYDPLRCLQNMLRVSKPGAWIGVISVEDEGERQRYAGLHQWNFSVQGDRLRLWNRENDFFVDERLRGFDRLTVARVDHGTGLPIFQAALRKAP